LTGAFGSGWTLMACCLAIIYYTLYGHVANLAQAVKKGAESEGVEVTLFQV
jgi:NAD(P)H dehydrogenase (quinone)